MSIAVALTNHNQHSMVKETIEKLLSADTKPSRIYVLSDGKPFWDFSRNPRIVPLNNAGKFTGRCGNRNSVIAPFLQSDDDAIVFMDGDCFPDTPDFLESYSILLDNHDLVFGTRRHTSVDGLEMPPSDLLTANMDNLYHGKKLTYSDLRLVSGAVGAWRDAKKFTERLDLMLTGMIGWSCNFGFSRKGLERLREFQKATYGLDEGIFDSNAFQEGWGYEDVAMGIDALYAGLDITITDGVRVGHHSHNRSDGLFDHVKGRHAIMERYRGLEKASEGWEWVKRAALVASAFFTAGLITGMVTETINLLNVIGM